MLKDLADSLVGLGRALDVLLGADLVLDLSGLCGCVLVCVKWFMSCHKTYLVLGDGGLRSLVELLNGLLVVSEILLATDEDDGKTLAEVQNLRDPLLQQNQVSMLQGT